MSEIMNQVQAALEKAECASTAQEAAEDFRAVVRMLEPLGAGKRDSQMAYALGYALYNLLDETSDEVALVEKCLQEAITKAPDNYYAVLYLGHLFFDLQRYDEALRQFQKIPQCYFKQHKQMWRDIKLAELIVCCFLYERKPKEAVDALSRLIEESSKASDIDRPNMTEIAKTLENILAR